MLRHRKGSECNAKSCSRRLIHLTEDHGSLVDNALLGAVYVLKGRFGHFEPEVISFTSSLSDTGEHRHAGSFHRDVSDELLNQNRLAQTGTTKETDLSTLVEGDHEVNNLQTGTEQFDASRLIFIARWLAVNWIARIVGRNGLTVIDRLAE